MGTLSIKAIQLRITNLFNKIEDCEKAMNELSSATIAGENVYSMTRNRLLYRVTTVQSMIDMNERLGIKVADDDYENHYAVTNYHFDACLQMLKLRDMKQHYHIRLEYWQKYLFLCHTREEVTAYNNSVELAEMQTQPEHESKDIA